MLERFMRRLLAWNGNPAVLMVQMLWPHNVPWMVGDVVFASSRAPTSSDRVRMESVTSVRGLSSVTTGHL